MPRRSLRFAWVGAAILGAFLCVGIVAAAPPPARAALPAANPTVTISTNAQGNTLFDPCPSQANPLEIQAGTAITFTNTTKNDVTVTFKFPAGRTQNTSVAAGASVDIVPNFATEFTFGISQTCFVAVSEALPTPTNTAAGTAIPGSVPSTGGGPVHPTGRSSWMLWGALLTTLGLAGLGGTLLARRRWLHQR